MSVEYALLLVVISGAMVGLLGFGLDVPFEKAKCAFEAALNGGSCDGGTVPGPTPTTSEPGPHPTGAPTTQTPIPADSTPACDSTSSTSGASATASQTETTDCTTTTNAD
jgi:hypothetical protein